MKTFGCPQCGGAESEVVDSRRKAGYIRRRRECVLCETRFTTREMPVEDIKDLQALRQAVRGFVKAWEAAK